MKVIQKKLLDIFKTTITERKNFKYNGNIDDINHFNLLIEAGIQNSLYKLFGCDMCMANFEYKEKPAVIMVFSIPINQDTGNKLIADRVMEIIGNIEDCFTTADYSHSKEQKSDKFIYVTIVKVIDETILKEGEVLCKP